MLTPRELLEITDGSTEIASQLHAYILQELIDRMMLRLGRGADYLFTSSDKWRIQIMQDAGYLFEDITAELAKYTRLQEKEIRDAMQDAGIRSTEWDNKIYQEAGLSPVPLYQSPPLIRIMERNYHATLGEWKNYTRTAAEEAQRLFINECDFAYHKVTTGAVSYTQAVKEAIYKIGRASCRERV